MNKILSNGITSAMMALGLCGSPVQAYSTYVNRSYMRANGSDSNALAGQTVSHQLDSNATRLSHSLMQLSLSKAPGVELKKNAFQTELLENPVSEPLSLEIKKKQQVTELIIIDQAVPDKHAFYKDSKPGVDIVDIRSDQDGLHQLKQILSRYTNLDALHLVSHASDGVVYLGNLVITEQVLKHEVDTLASLNDALKDGGDILFYGCNLASGQRGKSFIELIANHANVDVAASSNLTGNTEAHGDWELELATGTIDTLSPFSPASLKDFSSVLALTGGSGTITMEGFGTSYAASHSYNAGGGFIIEFTTNSSNAQDLGAFAGSGGYITVDSYGNNNINKVYSDFTGGETFNATSIELTNFSGGSQAFRITSDVGDSHDVSVNNGVTQNITLTSFDGISKLTIATQGGGNLGQFLIRSMVITNVAPPNNAPTATGIPTDVTVTEDTASNFNLSSVSFADSDGDSLTATLAAGAGTFAATSGGGVTVGGSGTGTLTLAGTAANINTWLDTASNIQYTGASNVNGNDATTVTVNANDGTVNPLLGTINVDITVVNDAPSATGIPTDVTVTEDTASNFNLSSITFADVDGDGLTVTLAAGAGTFAASSGGGVTVGGSGTGTMTLAGTAANINTWLDTISNLQYTGASNVNGNDATTVSVNANDGTVNPLLGTINVDITATNDAPTATGIPTDVTVIEATASNFDLATITLADIDGDSLTITLAAGAGTFAASSGGGVTVGGSGTGTLTLAGTVANINNYLDTASNLQYTGPAATSGNDATTVTINANDGTVNPLLGTVNVDITPGNTTPVISNLNGDSVAWAGVASTVGLDSSGNGAISDTELDALNGGNGDYSGGSLTVQRNGGAVTTDILGFDTSGAFFTVSGSNLQSGGQTFATFTNSNGVLTISFASSGTTATTALASDVLQRITYRNDTPSGDATVRFTLSDGTASTTADVTVTTDNIYVTNTIDTASIDPSNGISFSEAIAIAATDGTGTQTIILDSTLAGQTVSSASVTLLSESLTLNLDFATGVTLSGGSLSLGDGITLTFNNASGDTASIGTAFSGTGALAKTGDGAVTLTAVQSYSGTTTVSGGTITVANSSNLGFGQLVMNGGTLQVTSGGTINQAINMTAESTISNAGSLTLSGLISGTGNLNKTGAGQLTPSHSGNEGSFSGGLIITEGGVYISDDDYLPSGAVTFNGGSFISSGSSGASTTIDNNFVVNPAGGTFHIFGGGGNYTLIVSGVISGSGDLTKITSSALTLSGTNTYTGGLTISTGKVTIAGDPNLGAGAITLNGGTIEVTGSGVTIDNALAASSGSISNANNLTWSGVISGAGTYSKLGAGTLTLSGTQTQTGGITVTAGGISVAGDSNLGAGTLTLNGGALTVTGSSNIDNAISLGASHGTVNNADTLTLSGIIDGSGNLTKTGAGELTLSATNTYAGLTSIAAGTVITTGSLAGAVTVDSGAFLQVGGSINGLVTVNSGGWILTNNSPVAVTLGNGLTVNAGGTINARIAGNVAGTGYDQYNVTGAVTLAGTLSLTGAYAPTSGDTFAIITNDAADAVSSTFNGLAEGASIAFSGEQLAVSYLGNTGNDVTLTMVAPTVNSVSVPSNGTYITGHNLNFTVNTDENITVNTGGGIPQIALTLGATTRQASYLSGSGTSAIVFRYTIQAGDSDTDGIAVAASIDANGGTLQDSSGNNLNTVLNSVGATISVLVDAVAPTVSNVSVPANATYIAGQNLDFTVNTDENVTVNTGAGTPRIALTVGATTRYGEYLSGTGTSALVFRYNVQAGDNDSDGISVAASIDANDATLQDSSGNDLNTTLNSVGATTSVLVDAVAPTVSSVGVPANATYAAGQNLNFTVNASENITVNTGGGTPRIALTIGATTRQATYLSGSGTSALVFRYTAQAGDSDTDGITVAASIDTNDGTLQDGSGNNLNTTLNSVSATTSVLVDGVAPTISSVSVPANATYITGQNLDFTVNTDENISVNTGGGTPRIALTIGAITRYAAYLSGSGTSAVVFRYTVQAGDSDSDGIAVAASIEANGGTLQDGAGNVLNTTLNSVGATASVLVDTVAPTVSSVSVPANATYVASQNLDFTVNTDENVTVNTGGGTPRIALTVGATTRYADYLSGSGTSALTFRYVVQAGDLDTDGISLAASIDTNGGTLRDDASNNLNTTLNSVGATTSVLVDAQAPTLNSSSPTDNASGIQYDADLILTFSENVTALAGAGAVVQLYDSGDNLVTTAIVTSGDVDVNNNIVTVDFFPDLVANMAYYVHISDIAFQDAAGNNYAGIVDNTTLNFTVGNNAPLANADSASTNEDTAVQVDVLANDTDVDSTLNAASTAVGTAPTNGSTSINTVNGVIIYTPSANFNGSDSFTYTVADIHGTTSAAATVTITVNAVNDAPVAVNDMGTTTEDVLVSIDVADNDTDVDTGDSVDPATIVIVSNPANGTATVNAGEVDYDPNPDFNGSDSFTYTIEDQNGAVSNTATVTINVTGVNDLPTAANDSATVNEDEDVDIDVLTNDSDVDGTIDGTTVQVMAAPANGSTFVDALTGLITYTPAANFYGSDSFTYVVQDDAGGTSNAATVNLTVTSVNDAPVAANDTAIVQEDASIEVNVLGNDSDVDGTLVPASVEVVTASTDGSTSINASTGAITYTPNADFNGSDTFTYRVQDNLGLWSAAATVTMTVNNVNDAPTATDDSATTVEDTAAIINVLANDIDIDDGLNNASVVIVSTASNGSLVNNNNGTVTYTPDTAYVGNDSFSYTVADNSAVVSNVATVSITVTPGNIAPVISGSPATSGMVGTSYSFTPTASDADTDDTLTFSISGQPDWLNFSTTTGVLSGTPADAHVGTTGAITISVNDGEEGASLAAFTITVADGTDTDSDTISDYQEGLDMTDPLDPTSYLDITPPELMAPEDVTLDAFALFTPVHIKQLLGLPLSASNSELQTELAAMASDNVDGDGCCNPEVENILPGSVLLLPPGRNEVTWLAEDFMGNISEVTQIVNLRPLVSMSKDQTTVEGATASISVILNGKSPIYPFTVPFVIDNSSTANSSDHNLVAGTVTFTETNGIGQTRATISVNIVADAVSEGTETLVVRLDDRTSHAEDLANGYDPDNPDIYDINSGARIRHTLRIVEGNLAPDVGLQLQQGGVNTVLVAANAGPITVDALVSDPNPGDTHSFNWSGTDNVLVDTDGNTQNASFVFDPSGLNPGRYGLRVDVTDSQGAVGRSRLFFRVLANLPILSADVDSDGDGFDDQSEGTGDTDDDGIPDYLDNIEDSNVIPEEANVTRSFLMECDPGLRCRLGRFALVGASGGTHLEITELDEQDDLAPDPDFDPVGGIFDFEIRDLPEAGQSVQIAIPVRTAIPQNAVYRKFRDGTWNNFVENANNALHSTSGNEGFCPPPGDETWEPGLVAGHLCVQLTIEDGGPNDADGEMNSAIEDPGAVSVASNVSHNVRSTGGGSMSLSILLLLGFSLLIQAARNTRIRRILRVVTRKASKPLAVLAPVMLGSALLGQAEYSQAGDWQKDWRERSSIELAVYQTESSQSQSEFVNAMASDDVAVNVQRYDTSRTAWQLTYGYRVHERITLQVGYLDLGDVNIEFAAVAPDNATLEAALEQHYPAHADGWTVGYRFEHTLADNLFVTLDTGLYLWNGDIDVRGASINSPDSDKGLDLLLGLGLNYRLLEQLHLGIEIQRVFLNREDVDLLGMQIGWHF